MSQQPNNGHFPPALPAASTRDGRYAAGGASPGPGRGAAGRRVAPPESPVQQQQYPTGSLDRRARRPSGGRTPVQSVKVARMSPGPSIYRTMPLSPGGGIAPAGPGRSTPGRHTPGGGGGRQQPAVVRPVPQHAGAPPQHSGTYRTFSPVTVPRINQSPVGAVSSLQRLQTCITSTHAC